MIHIQNKCHSGDFGHYCRWLICASAVHADSFGTCGNIHIGNSSSRCALCCGTHSDEHQCKCNEIIDRESFIRCQKLNGME